jgi:hypothetical protein
MAELFKSNLELMLARQNARVPVSAIARLEGSGRKLRASTCS